MSGAVVKETCFFCSSSARAPATCGVAIDVPENIITYDDSPVQVEHAELTALPGPIISTRARVRVAGEVIVLVAGCHSDRLRRGSGEVQTRIRIVIVTRR